MQNTTHTVVIKQQNRGIAFLVGIVAIFLLFRWWLTGSLLAAVEFGIGKYPSNGEGVGSVTGTVVPIVFDIVVAFGGVLVFAMSGIWSVIFDVTSGMLEMFRTWRATTTATKTAINQAMSAAGATAGVSAVVSSVESASEPAPPPVANLSKDERIKEAIRTIVKRLQAVEANQQKMSDILFPPPPAPPPEPTVAELLAKIEKLEKQTTSKKSGVKTASNAGDA